MEGPKHRSRVAEAKEEYRDMFGVGPPVVQMPEGLALFRIAEALKNCHPMDGLDGEIPDDALL